MTLRLKSIALILLALASALGCYADGKDATFNLATYNIRQINDGDADRGDGWAQRCPIVAGLIRFHDFDIFGTQEGYKNQLEDLKALLPGYEYVGVARDDGKEAGEHSAIFYNTEKFELLDHGDFWLSETPDRPGLGWDAVCVRICTWGKFRHKESGKIFQHFNLHLDHIGTKARVESVLLVQKKMKEIGLDLPTFLTGDFNVDQNHDMYAVLAASDFLRDAFHASEFVYATNGTYNAYRTDGYTDSRIDHIFVSSDIAVEKYGVLTDTYRTPVTSDASIDGDKPAEITVAEYQSRVPSDHFPVLIKARF